MSDRNNKCFTPDTIKKIEAAICSVSRGDCARVDVNKSIKVYMCKNVIRIDLKITEEVNDYVCE